MILRRMSEADRPYVASTWARGSRYGLRTADAFRLVNAMLDRSDTWVLGQGKTVHAWACVGNDVLHYVYVPPELRGHGLAKKVIEQALGEYPDRIRVSHPWPRGSRRYRYDARLLPVRIVRTVEVE